MPKCYDKECENWVKEQYTYCEPCKDKHFPNHKPKSAMDLRQRVLELAKKAPKHVDVPYSPPTQPTAQIIKDKICCLCPTKKKNAVTVKLADNLYICWSHKATFEKTYGTQWRSNAIRMGKREQLAKTGEQGKFMS